MRSSSHAELSCVYIHTLEFKACAGPTVRPQTQLGSERSSNVLGLLKKTKNFSGYESFLVRGYIFTSSRRPANFSFLRLMVEAVEPVFCYSAPYGWIYTRFGTVVRSDSDLLNEELKFVVI